MRKITKIFENLSSERTFGQSDPGAPGAVLVAYCAPVLVIKPGGVLCFFHIMQIGLRHNRKKKIKIIKKSIDTLREKRYNIIRKKQETTQLRLNGGKK